MPKLRLSMPKKEEDLQKVVEEVYQEHPEMLEEEHHHHHDDEILMVLQSLIDAINHLTVHIASLDRRVEDMEKKIESLITQNNRILDAVVREKK